jgi:hypothetical protein
MGKTRNAYSPLGGRSEVSERLLFCEKNLELDASLG